MITTWHPGMLAFVLVSILLVCMLGSIFPPAWLTRKVSYLCLSLTFIGSAVLLIFFVCGIRMVNIAGLTGVHGAWSKDFSGRYRALPSSLWLTYTFNKKIASGEIWERTTPIDSEITAYSPAGRFTIVYSIPLPDNEMRIIQNLGITNRWDLAGAVDNVVLQAFGCHSTNAAELASDPLVDGIQILRVTRQDPMPQKTANK